MNLKNMNKDELELLSYADLSYMILKENNKPMNTPSIFKTICDLLEYSETQYMEKIGDFYTSLTTDKRFLLLETTEWDLKENHVVKVALEEDIEEESEESEEVEEEFDEDDEEFDEIEDIDEIDDNDNLSIITEDEMEDE